MRTSDMIKSKFWRAGDVQGQRPVVLTIAHVTEELLGRGSKQDLKCFLWFQDHQKGLQLNKTRVRILEAAYGPDSDLWTGKRVRLSFDPTVEFGGRAVGGVRLETPPGIVYQPVAAQTASWGGPAPATGPNQRPAQPVFDVDTGQWVLPQPIAAPQAYRAVSPPPPVYNEATGQWEVVSPVTGEIGQPVQQQQPQLQQQQPSFETRARTISERIAAGQPKTDWDAAGEDPEFGHADIPF